MTNTAAWPDWDVLLVHDDDGTGADFAYTVGLHDHQLPELHCSTIPAGGAVPIEGRDGRLDLDSIAGVLNLVAERCIVGTAAPGSVIEMSMDGGRHTAVFSLGDATYPASLDAWQVDDEASVIPITWHFDAYRASEAV